MCIYRMFNMKLPFLDCASVWSSTDCLWWTHHPSNSNGRHVRTESWPGKCLYMLLIQKDLCYSRICPAETAQVQVRTPYLSASVRFTPRTIRSAMVRLSTCEAAATAQTPSSLSVAQPWSTALSHGVAVLKEVLYIHCFLCSETTGFRMK